VTEPDDDEKMPVRDYCIPWDWDHEDLIYRDRIARQVYGMFTKHGNRAVAQAVADVRQLQAQGTLVTPAAIGQALRARMAAVANAYPEADDSEVWEHLVYAFIDIIPSTVRFKRGWLQSGYEPDGYPPPSIIAELMTPPRR
jgi:hypothetical protein